VAGVSGETASAIDDENAKARLRALRAALAVIAIVAAAALLLAGTIPTRQPGSQPPAAERGPPDLDRVSA
jgi:anti-sigma-K factor RskA